MNHLLKTVCLGLCVSWSSSLPAQAPQLGYLFPPAVERGTTTAVQLGGYNFTPDMQFFVYGTGLNLQVTGPPGPFLVTPRPYWEGPRIYTTALPIAREIPAKLTVLATQPASLVHWQAANANGTTAMATLYVSDHREIVEQRFRDEAIDVGSLPVGVSGRLSRLTETDHYQLTASKTGPLYLDVWARRLGSNINIALQVVAPGGEKLVDRVDTLGQDLQVSFPAQQGETYTIRLHEADFRGAAQFVYRLACSQQPPQIKADNRLKELPAGIPHQQTPLKLAAGKPYRIRALSQALGADLDLQLAIVDAANKILAENDDKTAATVDPEILYSAKDDQPLQLRVSGFAVGSQDAKRQYRIEVEELKRGYRLTAPQLVSGELGEKASIAVTLVPLATFKEDVTLRVDGLPPGVTVDGEAKIPAGKNKATINLAIAKESKVQAAVIKISGVSAGNEEMGLKPLEVVATAPRSGNLVVMNPELEVTEKILFAIKMKAPYKLQLIDKNRQRVVHAGTTYPAPFIVTRDKGYTGTIRMLMKAKQSRHRMGIRGPTVEIPTGITNVFYPCVMPEWLTTDRTTRMEVVGFGEVADPQGNVRHVGAASDARITMILEGALLKISQQANELTVSPGESFQIPVTITRSAKLPGPVTIDLETAGPLADLVSLKPLVLEAGVSTITLQVQTRADSRLRGVIPITVRATALQEDRWPVTSIVDVNVEFK
jgi:hypothetical protein